MVFTHRSVFRRVYAGSWPAAFFYIQDKKEREILELACSDPAGPLHKLGQAAQLQVLAIHTGLRRKRGSPARSLV